jgi:hypothetical protein
MDYKTYIRSKEWAEIRTKILEAANYVCAVCHGKACQVHHKSYSRDVLIGNVPKALVPLCHPCHYHIEFTNGKKNKLADANVKLKKARKIYPCVCPHCKKKQGMLTRRQDHTCTICGGTMVEVEKMPPFKKIGKNPR